MPGLRTAVLIVWVLFWLYWLISAANAKEGTRGRSLRARLPGLAFVVLAVVILRTATSVDLVVHSHVAKIVGTVVFLAGLALAVWARVHLGHNWGMPMTQKDEPELVTSGPYRLIRHPIYTGILLGVIGTALMVNLYLLILAAVMAAQFIYSARVEERNLTAAFPEAYARYRASSKMLIPFVL